MTRNPRASAVTLRVPATPPGVGSAATGAPDTSASHSSTRLESVCRTTAPSHSTMSSRPSVRAESGTVCRRARYASERYRSSSPSDRPSPSQATYSEKVIARSHISRTTDFGESASSATHGWVWRYVASSADSSSPNGFGHVDVVEQLHPLLVLEAVRLHLGNGLSASLELLGEQHLARVLQRRLDHGDDVQGVRRGVRVEDVHGAQGERGERLVEGEAELEVLDQPAQPAVGVGAVQPLDDAGGQERAVDLHRLSHVPDLPSWVLVVVP